MRTLTSGLICTLALLGCVDRTQGDEVSDESGTESESESGTETETGDEDAPQWVYSSTLHPRALSASDEGVIVGGAQITDFDAREADLIALSEAGELLWSATWLEARPLAVNHVAWTPIAIWASYEATSCGDLCYESAISRFDAQGVEQWRLDPIQPGIDALEPVDDDVVVAGFDENFSLLVRLDFDGSEVWRWDNNYDPNAPFVRDVALGEDGVLWAFGTRQNMTDVRSPWLGTFDANTGELTGELFAGLDPADGDGRSIQLLGDGLVVTQLGTLTALETDGVRTWQVGLPDGYCQIDATIDRVLIGCEAELQLRDDQLTRIGHWTDLEQTSADYRWRSVALGARAYAGIGSISTDTALEGKVYGIRL